MDPQKLRSLVFDKTGIKVDVDDPIFALVALNEAVLGEAAERHAAMLEAATRALAEQAELLLDGGAHCRYHAGGERPAALLMAPAAATAQVARDAGKREGATPWLRSAAAGAAGALAGVLLMQLVLASWFKPAPPPAPVLQARELSAEQSAAIRNGEKLARIVQKLDQKTRNTIAAEMQKP
ncbi:MAG: hypothetical protein V4582_05445 [Pseudomonadota bacterium]